MTFESFTEKFVCVFDVKFLSFIYIGGARIPGTRAHQWDVLAVWGIFVPLFRCVVAVAWSESMIGLKLALSEVRSLHNQITVRGTDPKGCLAVCPSWLAVQWLLGREPPMPLAARLW